MNVKKVYLWGFEDQELRAWPPDLQPVRSPRWPQDGPVVVHSRAVEAFQAEALAHPLPDGRLPEAVLYLPTGSQPPAEAWAFFDATMQEKDWDALRRLLLCPRLYEMEEMAEELPASFLADLVRPVRQLRAEKLPLPTEAREHLASCGVCRQAFDRAVEARLRLRRQLLCPSAEQLMAYLRGEPDFQVAEHLRMCRLCQAEVSVLQRTLAPAWLKLTLTRLSEEIWTRLAEVTHSYGQKGTEALAVLMNGLRRAGMVPAGARIGRVIAGGQQQWALDTLLELLRSEGGLQLARTPRELRLFWDAEAQAICLDSLSAGGSRAVEAFRVEICKGEVVLWQGDSQEGRLAIPVADLTRALEEGAEQLVIRAYQEPG